MTGDAAQFPLRTDALVPLESVLCTEELDRRPSRPPDFETENRALLLLVQALADSPRNILQILADSILQVFSADSAGVSLLTKEDGGKRFYWPAIAGVWKPYIGGGTPREFGPCGDVLASRLCQEHHQTLSVFLPDEAIWLEADRTRLLQVFANLLTNAAKYTKDGGRISLNAETDGTTATIRLQDDGKGIAPGALPHIFDLFTQEETDRSGGLGIGLRVVRELVELHGGSVTARSEGIGRGSEFIVRLPVALPAAT